MVCKTLFKVDLDIKTKNKALDFLILRIKYLISFGILKLKDIEKIELIKKNSYSVKIYYKKEIINDDLIILIQSVLGDDFKRTMICLRDLYLGIENWNRLFDIKRYPNGKYKIAKKLDVTKEIKEKLKNEK